MHIGIDAHSVGTGLAGNESYVTNLIEALLDLDRSNRYTLYITRVEAFERFANRWPNVTIRRTRPHTPLVRIPLALTLELRRRPVDLLHVQYTAPPWAPCPLVVTVHDLSFEHLPDTFKRRSRTQLRITVRRSVRAAAHIIASSEYSRRDIIETYGVAPSRVSAIPLAAAPLFRPVENETEKRRVRERFGIPENYILTVGSIQPRKNLVRLVSAYSRLRDTRPIDKLPNLVLVGKRGWLYGETLRAVETHGSGGDIQFTGYVPETDLPALYSGALCFVYPSYFEGFGLPPLEAMQCGTPVIAGNRTSLPEVVGVAGLLVDPYDEGEIGRALSRMIDGAELRARIGIEGLLRAKLFTWDRTARETLSIYERVYEVSRSEPASLQ